MSRSALLIFWEKLQEIKFFNFTAQSNLERENGWNGKGFGEILCSRENPNSLIFQERGLWKSQQGLESGFYNYFRWTLNSAPATISLVHLRRGPSQPVFLFALLPIQNNQLKSLCPHFCKKDAYFGFIHLKTNGFCLKWKIKGPQKNEEIYYNYFK
jgi:hypothetical protein